MQWKCCLIAFNHQRKNCTTGPWNVTRSPTNAATVYSELFTLHVTVTEEVVNKVVLRVSKHRQWWNISTALLYTTECISYTVRFWGSCPQLSIFSDWYLVLYNFTPSHFWDSIVLFNLLHLYDTSVTSYFADFRQHQSQRRQSEQAIYFSAVLLIPKTIYCRIITSVYSVSDTLRILLKNNSCVWLSLFPE